jgi:hypothetical protein
MQAWIDYYSKKNKNIKQVIPAGSSVGSKPPKAIKYLESTLRMLWLHDRRLIPAIKLRSSQIFQQREIRRYIKRVEQTPKLTEKYLYFPLHYQPECTSLPMAFRYSNQLIVIEMISALLPNDIFLYTKRHPTTSQLADKSFYKKINQYENVRLLPDATDSYEMIDGALAVVSLTGTTLWESIVRGTPALMFGYYIYQYAPGVFHIQSKDDLKKAILSLMENGKPSISMDDLKLFLRTLDHFCYDGHMGGLEDLYNISEQDNIDNTVKGYMDFIDDEDNWDINEEIV